MLKILEITFGHLQRQIPDLSLIQGSLDIVYSETNKQVEGDDGNEKEKYDKDGVGHPGEGNFPVRKKNVWIFQFSAHHYQSLQKSILGRPKHFLVFQQDMEAKGKGKNKDEDDN